MTTQEKKEIVSIANEIIARANTLKSCFAENENSSKHNAEYLNCLSTYTYLIGKNIDELKKHL